MKRCLFDLDGTLINTTKLRPFRCTREGRKFIIDNPKKVPSTSFSPGLTKLVNKLSKEINVEIITNSPVDYSQVLLKKHGFLDLYTYGSLGKPDISKLKDVSFELMDSIIIGDKPTDILAAHELNIPSIAVSWGESTLKKLSKSEPSRIVSNISELEEAIEDFRSNRIVYHKRKNPKDYSFLKNIPLIDPEIKISFLEDYYPITRFYPHGNPNYEFTSDVLRFKECKNFKSSQIKNGQKNEYFAKGTIQNGKEFKKVIYKFYNLLIEKIDSMGIKGKTAVLAAPNSLPEFCYLFDVNKRIAKTINRNIFKDANHSKRTIYRVYPKTSAHKSGNRGEHYSTTGIKKETSLEGLKNVILFDDIYTSGSQIKALGNIIRNLGNFNGNLYSLTLGKTSSNSF